MLIALAILFFLVAKFLTLFSDHYCEYWRTVKILPGPFMAAGMLCSWLATSHLALAHSIALIILILCGCSLVCMLIVSIFSFIGMFFGDGGLEILEIFSIFHDIAVDWKCSWKCQKGDICACIALAVSTVGIYVYTLGDMISVLK